MAKALLWEETAGNIAPTPYGSAPTGVPGLVYTNDPAAPLPFVPVATVGVPAPAGGDCGCQHDSGPGVTPAGGAGVGAPLPVSNPSMAASAAPSGTATASSSAPAAPRDPREALPFVGRGALFLVGVLVLLALAKSRR